MAATNKRLEKVLSHMQANTNSLNLQETAAQELSDNDVVIVRYVLPPLSPSYLVLRSALLPSRSESRNDTRQTLIATLTFLCILSR